MPTDALQFDYFWMDRWGVPVQLQITASVVRDSTGARSLELIDAVDEWAQDRLGEFSPEQYEAAVALGVSHLRVDP